MLLRKNSSYASCWELEEPEGTLESTSTQVGRGVEGPAFGMTSFARLEEDDVDDVMKNLAPCHRAAASTFSELPAELRAAMNDLAQDNVQRGLRHKHWLARWRAIQVVRTTHKRGDAAALEDVAPLLADHVAENRVAALEAVGALARVGNPWATREVLASLKDEWELVRTAAARAAAEVCEPGDAFALVALDRTLDDEATLVRAAAIAALHKIGTKGDALVANGLVRRRNPKPATTLEATQGQIFSQSPTDATSSR